MMAATRKTVGCPVEITLRAIGGRWKAMVLHYLFKGTQRFNMLHRLLGGISHRTLAKQLRELEHDGILSRKVYPVIPPRVEYSLTHFGRTLKPVLLAMHRWGNTYSRRIGAGS